MSEGVNDGRQRRPAALTRGELGALLVLCGALFLDSLDISMVGVALPRIGASLHLSTETLQWVVGGYVLGYGGLLMLGGRAADLLGRRRVFLWALAVFLVASLLGGLAQDGTVLIVTRLIKGMSAAFTAPAGLSIITTTFPEGPHRNRAMGIYTATGASGYTLGLVVGGLLTAAGWRYVLFVPAPVALALLVLAPSRLRPDPPREGARRSYDVAGAVTITGGMLAVVYAITQAPAHGWVSARSLELFAAAIVLLAAFVAIELRTADPLIRLGVLRSGRLVRANAVAMASCGAYFGFQFVTTLYLQQLLHWSPLVTALAFLPAGLVVGAIGPRTGPLMTRPGTSRILVVGMAASLAGDALLIRIAATTHYATVILPTMLLLGLAMALIFPALNVAATSGVADKEQGLASGLVNTSIQLGGAVVLAIVTAAISAGSGDRRSPQALLSGFHPALLVVTAVSALGLLVALSGAGLFTARDDRPREQHLQTD